MARIRAACAEEIPRKCGERRTAYKGLDVS